MVPTDGLYNTGVYRVGSDIPAGEYKVTTNEDEEYGYYSVTNDMNGDDIETNGNLDA